jgi:hypothetical protein
MKERQSLIHMDEYTVRAFEEYKKARDARDTERESFRGDIAVADVEGGLEAIKADLEKQGQAMDD